MSATATTPDLKELVASLSKENLARLAGIVTERLWAEKPMTQFGPIPIHRADGKLIGNLHYPPPDLSDPDTAAFVARSLERLNDPNRTYVPIEDVIERLEKRIAANRAATAS